MMEDIVNKKRKNQNIKLTMNVQQRAYLSVMRFMIFSKCWAQSCDGNSHQNLNPLCVSIRHIQFPISINAC